MKQRIVGRNCIYKNCNKCGIPELGQLTETKQGLFGKKNRYAWIIKIFVLKIFWKNNQFKEKQIFYIA